jgi:hypothetical protein
MGRFTTLITYFGYLARFVINTPFSEEPAQDVPIPPTVKSGISEIQTMILGFVVTPIFLALISVYTQTVCMWWIISGILIFTTTLVATALDRRFLFFACGSMLATMIFLYPWFEFVNATKIVCSDYSWV